MDKPANVSQAAVLNGHTLNSEHLHHTGTEKESFFKVWMPPPTMTRLEIDTMTSADWQARINISKGGIKWAWSKSSGNLAECWCGKNVALMAVFEIVDGAILALPTFTVKCSKKSVLCLSSKRLSVHLYHHHWSCCLFEVVFISITWVGFFWVIVVASHK